MSLLNEVIWSNEEDSVKVLAHLIKIINILGWKSITDRSVIKPNIRPAQLYLRRNSKTLDKLFGVNVKALHKYDVVDAINPCLITMWGVQIIGDVDSASLELMTRNPS